MIIDSFKILKISSGSLGTVKVQSYGSTLANSSGLQYANNSITDSAPLEKKVFYKFHIPL